MIQVKIIRNETQLIERDINQWLQSLGNIKGYSFQVVDIKWYHIDEKDVDTVMIIYTQKRDDNYTVQDY